MQALEERQVDLMPQSVNTNWINEDTLVIILQVRNPVFAWGPKAFDHEIYGKKMWEWVALAASGCNIKTTTCTEESNILSLIKPLLSNSKYTAVLYSDTPLLQRSTFVEVMEYFRQREANVLKLTRGYIFNTEYIRNATSINAVQNKFFNEEDFLIASNHEKLALISDIMRKRILTFHMNNGVFIESLENVYIDADVIIERGVRIYGTNTIQGQSLIQKNAIIQHGNVIISSIVSSGCTITSSHLLECRISENVAVGPFEIIVRKNI